MSASVLIAGAGPSGLVLALALVQNGISVRIIDKEPKYRVGRRGAGIMVRTLEVYNYLGVLPDVLEQGGLPPSMRSYELPEGIKPTKTWSIINTEEPSPAVPYSNPIMLGQDRAEAILRSHLEKYSTRVELGTELRSFEQTSEGVVAHLVKVQNDREIPETVKANWLIGTDGARGVVRKQLGLTFLGETRDAQRFVVGDLRLPGFSRDYWHKWGEASTVMVMILPSERADDDLFSFALGGHGVDHEKLAADPEELVNFIRSSTGRNDITCREVVWVADFKPNVRMVNKFGEGRVFVAGDAAHVHSPTGGQGMNSSVQDSFNLAWKLALVEKGIAPPSLLDTYTEERLPVIAEMLNQTTALLDKTYAAKAGDETPWRRGKALQMLGVNYRWSSIVIDEHVTGDAGQSGRVDSYGTSGDGRIGAGDRAPDIPGLVDVKSGETTTLFKILGCSHHTVLVFAGGVNHYTPILDSLKRYPSGTVRSVLVLPQATVIPEQAGADLVVEDKEGYAYQGYAVDKKDTAIVIVRPDGVVGAMVKGVEGVVKYFKGIFLM